jgi:hypothetical protein
MLNAILLKLSSSCFNLAGSKSKYTDWFENTLIISRVEFKLESTKYASKY